MELREAFGHVEIVIPVAIATRGHEPPMPNGTFVEARYRDVPLQVHDKLELDSELFKGITSVVLKDAGIGSVMGLEWYTPRLEMRRAQLDPSGFGPLSVLKDVFRDMWYCVAFGAGFFWVRYDWLVPIRAPGDDG